MRRNLILRLILIYWNALRSSSYLLLVPVIFITYLVSVAFFFPTGYSYDVSCTRCGGDGTVACHSCWTGVCIACGGFGVNPTGWCAFCRGSGVCEQCQGIGYLQCSGCGGDGLVVKWMFNLMGIMVFASLSNVFLFLGSFVLGTYLTAFYLSFNEWIHQVGHMDFLFNPSFMIWLFATNRVRWVKWFTGSSFLGTILIGPILFLAFTSGKIEADIFEVGILISIVILGLFAYLFYLSYIRTLKSSEKQIVHHK